MTQEEHIINKRADELEKIGFVVNCGKDSIWYEKGDIKMIPILMMCVSEAQWRQFIEQNTDKNPPQQS